MNTEASFPVIIHEDLRLLGKFFGKMGHVKLRFSSTVLKGSCIFPKASVAFLLLNEDEAGDEKCLERILPNAYYVLLAEGMSEAVEVMLSTAEAHSLSTVAKLNEGMVAFFNAATSEDVVTNILVSLGLSTQESSLAVDACGGLSDILSMSAEQIKEFGLDDMTARKLAEFSKKDMYCT